MVIPKNVRSYFSHLQGGRLDGGGDFDAASPGLQLQPWLCRSCRGLMPNGRPHKGWQRAELSGASGVVQRLRFHPAALCWWQNAHHAPIAGTLAEAGCPSLRGGGRLSGGVSPRSADDVVSATGPDHGTTQDPC